MKDRLFSGYRRCLASGNEDMRRTEEANIGGKLIVKTMAAAVLLAVVCAYLVEPFNVYAQSKTSRRSSARKSTAVIAVGGMTCASCAAHLRGELKKAPGVASVQVSFADKRATVVYDSKVTTLQTLRSVIEAAGYTAGDGSSETVTKTPVSKSNFPLAPLSLEDLKAEFNRSSQSLRLVSILSPTCPECQAGRGVVKSVFEKFASDKLRGLVVFLPMRGGDDAVSARVESELLADKRLAQGWDGERRIGELFGKTLKLKGAAWDVYLLYAPGVRWEGVEAPAPSFWMHQLTEEAGADQAMCLNPRRLIQATQRLLNDQ